MSTNENIVAEQTLRALGLDPVCVRVYLLMHSMPNTDVAQIGEILNLQVSEVTDALDELSDLTLIRAGLTPGHQQRPVSIARAIQALLRQQSEKLKAQSDSLVMLQSAMRELVESKPAEVGFGQVNVETIIGSEEGQSYLEQLSLGTRESLWSTMPGGILRPEMLDAARSFDEELCQRGVLARAIYQNSVKGDRRVMEYIRWLSGLGAQIRFAPVVPFRLLIMDRGAGVIARKEAKLPVETFIIREPAILMPIIELFELSWAAAEPLADDAPKQLDEKAPSSQELALLRLLAAGGTDEAAGKKLGISVRTVRRIMADLMERLEATSRFEAGHKATQRGWL